MSGDEQKEDEKQGKLKLDSQGMHVIDPNLEQRISVSGQAATTDTTDVFVKTSYSDEVQRAQTGPNGRFGVTVQEPKTPGEHTISAESGGQKTSTPLIAKEKKDP